jgi:hypothetical protein
LGLSGFAASFSLSSPLSFSFSSIIFFFFSSSVVLKDTVHRFRLDYRVRACVRRWVGEWVGATEDKAKMACAEDVCGVR